MIPERLNRRRLGLVDRVKRSGQENGDCAGRGQRFGIRLCRIFNVVGRERLVLSSQGGATQVAQLLGMQFDREAKLLRHIEHPRNLRGVKGDPFAEPVDRID